VAAEMLWILKSAEIFLFNFTMFTAIIKTKISMKKQVILFQCNFIMRGKKQVALNERKENLTK